MMPETVQLVDVIELTERVQVAITAGEWREATDLELERRALLARYLEQHRDGGLASVNSDLADLQDSNNRLIGEVFHHRRRLAREATMVRTGRRAIRAYGAQQAGPFNPE